MTDRPCGTSGCNTPASFWYYSEETAAWAPVCQAHAEQLHPSTEIKTWLFSGYMKPIELGEPRDPPSDPVDGREAAFRAEIVALMDW